MRKQSLESPNPLVIRFQNDTQDNFNIQNNKKQCQQVEDTVLELQHGSPHQSRQPQNIDNLNLNQKISFQNNNQSLQSSNQSRLIILIRNLITSRVYSYIYLTFMIIYTIACLIYDPKNKSLSNISFYLEMKCHIFFIISAIMRIIGEQNRSIFWIAVELLSSLMGIIGLSLSYPTVQYFKALRTLKLLMLIEKLTSLNQAASKLFKILNNVGKILCPAAIFIYIYAVVGLYSFSDYQYNRCRSESNKQLHSNWTVYEEQFQLCGQRACPTVEGQHLLCLNPIDYSVEPNSKQLNVMEFGEGLMIYRNIFYALFSTYKQTFLTGSSRQINLYKQVVHPAYVLIYYLTFIYLISYVYLNIFYGLMITYQQSNTEQKKQHKKNTKKTNSKHHISKKSIKQNPLKQQKQLQHDDHIQQIKLQSNIKENKKQIEDQQPNKQVNKKIVKVVFQSEEDDKSKNIEHNQSIEISSQNINKRENSCQSQSQKNFAKYKIISNFLTLLFSINIIIEFQQQSQKISYIQNLIDFIYYLFILLDIIIKLYVIIKIFGKKVTTNLQLEIGIFIVCSIGIIYEIIKCQNVGFLHFQDKISKTFRVLKYLRLISLFTSIRYFQEGKTILLSTIEAVYKIKSTIFLWLFFIILSSIMGFHLFAYKTKVDSHKKLDLIKGKQFQVSFDGIYNSIIYTFMTFYNEQWDQLMFQQYIGSGVLVVFWQILMISFGSTIISKYLMALLMKQLCDVLDKKTQYIDEIHNYISTNQINIAELKTQQNQQDHHKQNNPQKIGYISQINGENQLNKVCPEIQIFNNKIQLGINLHKKSTKFIKNQFSQQPTGTDILINKLFLVLKNMLASKVYHIIKILFLIDLLVWLVLDHPQLDPKSSLAKILAIMNLINSWFFLIQLICNLIVFGLFKQKDSYLRKSWINVINLMIVIIQTLSYTSIGSTSTFISFTSIKVLRILYFLEIRYDENTNMRLTITGFAKLIPKIIKLLVITCLIFGFFGIILVKLYKKQFYYCMNQSEIEEIYTRQDCLYLGGDWVQRQVNVSNFLSSLLYLFLVSTTEGWIEQMNFGANVRGQNLAPIEGSNPSYEIFFVGFFFFGNFIIMNVFIGLSIYNFKKIKQQVTGIASLKPLQKLWLTIKTQIYRLSPQIIDRVPENTLRKYCFIFSTSITFKIFKFLLFLIFTVLMSLFQTNMDPNFKNILIKVPYVFALILVIQMVIQVMAYGIRKDYRIRLMFQVFIIVYAFILGVLDFSNNLKKDNQKIFGGVLVALLFFHYFSLLNEFQIFKKMFNSIITILPQTTNIFLIMITVIFIYTELGMQLFSYLKVGQELDSFNQNYQSYGNAIWALIKFSTLELPINQISNASHQFGSEFVCYQINTYDEFLMWGQNGCGSKVKAYLFFISFHIIYSLVLLPTLIAIIVDTYAQVRAEEQAVVNKFALAAVKQEWKQYDPDGTGFISYRDFWLFTAKLMKIYKADQNQVMSSDTKQSFLKVLNIPIYQNKDGVLCFQFNQVIEALTRIIVFRSQKKSDFTSMKADKMFKERRSSFGPVLKKSIYNSSHVLTLIILKSGLKVWKKKISDKKNCVSIFTSVGIRRQNNIVQNI